MVSHRLGQMIGDRKRVLSARAAGSAAAPCGLPAVALLAPKGLGMRAQGAPRLRRLRPPLRGPRRGVRYPPPSGLPALAGRLDG